MRIVIEHHPSPDRLRELGFEAWPTWGTGISRFPWTHGERETGHMLAGMSCAWDARAPIRKHYRFG